MGRGDMCKRLSRDARGVVDGEVRIREREVFLGACLAALEEVLAKARRGRESFMVVDETAGQ